MKTQILFCILLLIPIRLFSQTTIPDYVDKQVKELHTDNPAMKTYVLALLKTGLQR